MKYMEISPNKVVNWVRDELDGVEKLSLFMMTLWEASHCGATDKNTRVTGRRRVIVTPRAEDENRMSKR